MVAGKRRESRATMPEGTSGSPQSSLIDNEHGAGENKEKDHLPSWTVPLQYGAIHAGGSPAVVTCGPMDVFLWGGIQQSLREGSGPLPYKLKRFANSSTGLLLFVTAAVSLFSMVAILIKFDFPWYALLGFWIMTTLLTCALGALLFHTLHRHYYAEKVEQMHRVLGQQMDQFNQDYGREQGFEVTYQKPSSNYWWSNAQIRIDQLEEEFGPGPCTAATSTTLSEEEGLDEQKVVPKDEYVYFLVASPWTRNQTAIDICTYGAIVETWMPLVHAWESLHLQGFLLTIMIGAAFKLSFLFLLLVVVLYQRLSELYFCRIVMPRAQQSLKNLNDRAQSRCGYRAEIVIPELGPLETAFSQVKIRLFRAMPEDP